MIEDIFSFTLRGIFKIVKILLGSLVLAVISGSIWWFIGRVLGAEWGYFSMIRWHFVIWIAIDIVLTIIQAGGTSDYNHRAGRTRWW